MSHYQSMVLYSSLIFKANFTLPNKPSVNQVAPLSSTKIRLSIYKGFFIDYSKDDLMSCIQTRNFSYSLDIQLAKHRYQLEDKIMQIYAQRYPKLINHQKFEESVYRQVIRDKREEYMAERIREVMGNKDMTMSQYKLVGIVGAKHVYNLNKRLKELK
ncbi:hypothetical protein FGO68_gene493 [Halteria grandinella]|uniref:Uncharacterized protein n=1 Tax=Halteria grandinella TaxID=5974 RepID=A0A8J8P280_HALGN|nr:hypothetical protein FGO68_gene493 [Halteria grandinella]